jgi:enoyl-CoA hydratase/carnithine racemase
MPVTVEQRGAAVLVTLRWTERRNALGPADAAELADVLEAANEQVTTGLVLTGEGAFCAGGDLRTFAELSAGRTPEQIRERVYGDVQRIVRAIGNCPGPTIAAVDGPAIGLGLDLALACDMRFIGPSGWLQQGWARAGLIHGGGGLGMLHALNPSVLWEQIVRQDRLDGERCEQLGLGVAVEESAVAAALERMEQLAGIPEVALRGYVELSRSVRWPSEHHFARSADLQSQLIGSEGFRSMAAKLLGGTTTDTGRR